MPLAVCATPIGNLEDVTLRVLRELAEAELVLCEDTRHTREAARPARRSGTGSLSYHEHNEATADGGAAAAARAPASASRSSATRGCPAINDPGARLIAAALDAGVPVTVLPGAVGGRDGARRERARRRAVPVRRLPPAWRAGACERSGEELARWPWAVVAFESPQRLPGARSRSSRGCSRSGRSRSAAS